MKQKHIVAGLAFAALFFAILHPPEAYPDGKLAVILCATFAFFISVKERRISPAYIQGGLALFGFLLLHTLFFSIDAFRSLDFISMLWAYYCLLGFFLHVEFEPLKPFAVCMVALSVIVSGYGVYQYFWGFQQLYDYAFYASTKELVQTKAALTTIATRRVFSTLALPGTLWGFLAVALPFHAVLWRDNRWIKLGLSASAGLLLLTGLLTRSFGFLLGVLVLAAAWMWMRHRHLLWRLAPLVVVVALIGGAFYSLRRGGIEGSNPFVLRAKNWVSAWSIFAAHPMGVGLNNYGITYSQHMLPGANETQYAHNTPMQMLSELGYPALITGAALLLLAIQAWRQGRYKAVSPYVVLTLVVWGTHNLVDINIYFPSVGVIGAVLLALMLKKSSTVPQFPASVGSTATVALGVMVLFFSTLTMISAELQHRAQIEYDENKLEVASVTLEQARLIMPMNSSLFHDFGDINLALYHRRHDARFLEAATSSFRQAIALSPEKVGPHIGLGLCLSSANRVDEALEELRLAKRLQPGSRQVSAISRLMEKRNERASK